MTLETHSNIANDGAAAEDISCGSVPDGIIAVFILAVFFVKQFDAVIVKEHAGGTAEGNTMLFDVELVFFFVVLESHASENENNSPAICQA